MKPSEQVKAAGLKSLAELSKTSGVSEQTLINWHKNKPRLFELVLLGAVTQKHIKQVEHGKQMALDDGLLQKPQATGSTSLGVGSGQKCVGRIY